MLLVLFVGPYLALCRTPPPSARFVREDETPRPFWRTVRAPCIWGTRNFCDPRLDRAPGGYPTYLAATLRFAIAALVLGGIVAAGWVRPRPRGRRAFAALGISGVSTA